MEDKYPGKKVFGNKFTQGCFPINKNSQYFSCNAHGDVVQLVENEELVRN